MEEEDDTLISLLNFTAKVFLNLLCKNIKMYKKKSLTIRNIVKFILLMLVKK